MELRNRIRAIFFDLDETLVDDDRCMREALIRTCAALAQKCPQIKAARLASTYTRVSDDLWTSFGSVPRAPGSETSSGRELRLYVWGRTLAAYGLSDENLAAEAVDVYSRERRAGYCLFPDVGEVLRALHKRFRLGVITNGPTETQHEKMQVTGLLDYLDVFFISGELGIGKPDAGIFLKALDSVRVTPREAVYVGDSLTSDVAGAKGAGIYTVWMNRKKMAQPPETPSPDFEISSLHDLMALLAPG